MRETWYILEDGTTVDPNEVAPNDSGALLHKSGAAVAMRGDVPSTRSVDPEELRAKAKDLKAQQPKRGYHTRESKAG